MDRQGEGRLAAGALGGGWQPRGRRGSKASPRASRRRARRVWNSAVPIGRRGISPVRFRPIVGGAGEGVVFFLSADGKKVGGSPEPEKAVFASGSAVTCSAEADTASVGTHPPSGGKTLELASTARANPPRGSVARGPRWGQARGGRGGRRSALKLAYLRGFYCFPQGASWLGGTDGVCGFGSRGLSIGRAALHARAEGSERGRDEVKREEYGIPQHWLGIAKSKGRVGFLGGRIAGGSMERGKSGARGTPTEGGRRESL